MHVTLICADDDAWALGARSISAALRTAGHQTRMIFAGSARAPFGERESESVGLLVRASDVVGISSMSRGSKRAKAILACLRLLGKKTVWGGMHPTLYPEDCAPHADLICRGEGEGFMIELVERMTEGKDLRDIPNAGFWKNGRVILNDVSPPFPTLDDLPFLDFAFEEELYLSREGEFVPHSSMKEASHILFSGSRGCAYNCHYCSNAQLKALYQGKGRYPRKMSVPSFVTASKECKRLFPRAKYIYFTDEDFFARPVEEIREFAKSYPEQVGLPFECMASPLQLTEEKMEFLAKAGMWRVDVGVETGSDDIKKCVFNRPADNEAVMRAASIINAFPQVVAYYFFIIGNPYEQRRDLLQTIGLVERMPPAFFLRAYSLVFIPGTQLFERACRDGIITGIEDSGYEIDFLAGLDHKTHAWKRNNLYLNSLIFLMAGKSTRRRIGFLPRKLISILKGPRIIGFCDKHTFVGKSLVAIGKLGLRARRAGLAFATKVLKDNKIAYGMKFLRKARVQGAAGQGPDLK